MLNLVIIIAFAGVIIISAGFAGVTFMQGVQSSLDAEITTQRLLDVATQVQSHARYLEPQGTGTAANYITALPTGVTGSAPYAYNQVPSFITSSARAANGVPFEYCPYATANQTGTASTVTMGDGTTTYNIKYYSGTDTNSQNYDTDQNGTTTPTNSSLNTLGFLVAAAPNKFYPPNCSAITTDSTGAYTTASGGIVAVIGNDYINKMKVPASMTDFRLYVSTSPTGDGSGRDASNYITLGDAMNIVQTLKPASAMIYVDATGSPTYSLTTTSGSGNSFSYGTRIYLEGINGSGAIINTSSNITVDEYSLLSIGNLTFQINGGTGTITINGTLEMADTSPTLTAGTIQVYGGAIKGFTTTMTFSGNVTVNNGGVIASSGPMLFNGLGNRGFSLLNGHVYGGSTMGFNTVAASSTANIVPIIIKAGGDMIAGTSTLTIGNTSTAITGGMIVDPGGRFLGAANSLITVANSPRLFGGNAQASSVLINKASSYGFYVHGELDLMPESATNAATAGVAVDYSASPPTDGIILASGGKFLLEATTGVSIGTSAHRPTIGILDSGGSGIFTMGSTGNNVIYANTTGGSCWNYNNVAPTNVANLFSDSALGTTNNNTTSTQTTTFPNGWYRLYNNTANLICTLS